MDLKTINDPEIGGPEDLKSIKVPKTSIWIDLDGFWWILKSIRIWPKWFRSGHCKEITINVLPICYQCIAQTFP